MIVLLLASLGLAAGPEPVAVAPVSPSASHHEVVVSVRPGESVADAVERAMVSRGQPDCGAVLALGPSETVRDALVSNTTRSMPPWAPLRAAECLADLSATDDVALAQVQRLVALPDQPGFALAIVPHLDAIPEARAVELARAALSNPSPALKTRLPRSLGTSTHAAVRALPR